ncbi:MAG: hypothetical protein LW768_10265, partial [Rubrivivax sp.]|nr:hypothetical protein [Rubrivivax sp.]
MPKPYDKRLTDTVDFIRNTAVLQRNGAWQGTVADHCDDWMTRASDDLQKQVSEVISQGWTKDGGTLRSYRRAIALLGHVAGALQYQTFSAMSATNFKNAKDIGARSRAVRGVAFDA